MLWVSLVTSRLRKKNNDRRALSWRDEQGVHKNQNFRGVESNQNVLCRMKIWITRDDSGTHLRAMWSAAGAGGSLRKAQVKRK